MSSLLSVTLPVTLTNSNGGRTKHWYQPAKERKAFEAILPRRTPLAVPVVVHVTRILGPRQRKWDSSSGLRGNYKELEDAMVACGWFVDDGPDWITETRFFQDAGQRGSGPAVHIEAWGT